MGGERGWRERAGGVRAPEGVEARAVRSDAVGGPREHDRAAHAVLVAHGGVPEQRARVSGVRGAAAADGLEGDGDAGDELAVQAVAADDADAAWEGEGRREGSGRRGLEGREGADMPFGGALLWRS